MPSRKRLRKIDIEHGKMAVDARRAELRYDEARRAFEALPDIAEPLPVHELRAAVADVRAWYRAINARAERIACKGRCDVCYGFLTRAVKASESATRLWSLYSEGVHDA